MSGPQRCPVPKLHRDPSYVPPAPLEAAEGPLVGRTPTTPDPFLPKCTHCGSPVTAVATQFGSEHREYIPVRHNEPCGCYV